MSRNSFHRSGFPNCHAFQSSVSVVIFKRCQDLLMRSRKIGAIGFQLEFKNSWVTQGVAPSTVAPCLRGHEPSPCCGPWAA